MDGKSNADVQSLHVQLDLQLSRMPRGIGDFFPNLKYMNWHFSALTEITAEDLRPFPGLVAFFVVHNNLISLDGDLFKYNPRLEWISLSGNNIQHVGQDLLMGLDQLDRIFIQSNPCINSFADSPELVRRLTFSLRSQCPSLECSFGCAIRFDAMESDFSNVSRELKSQIVLSLELNEKLAYQIDEQSEIISDLVTKTSSHGIQILDNFARISQHDSKLEDLDNKLLEKDLKLSQQHQEINDLRTQFADHSEKFLQLDERFLEQSEKVTEQNARISEQNRIILEQNEMISHLQLKVVEQSDKITQLNSLITDNEALTLELSHLVADYRTRTNELERKMDIVLDFPCPVC